MSSSSQSIGFIGSGGGVPSTAVTDCQLRLMEYAQRLLQQHQHSVFGQNPMSLFAAAATAPMPMFGSQIEVASPLLSTHPFQNLNRFLLQEDPKPQHSYIGLIAMAILSAPDQKMVLSDIYQYILDHYPYFRNRGPGWRNSIRHNLSLNDCFVKAGRSANGKGHYWAVHPANLDDFTRGDFRRRRAQRKVRRHMGLSVPDEDDSPCPSPLPQPLAQPLLLPAAGPPLLALPPPAAGEPTSTTTAPATAATTTSSTTTPISSAPGCCGGGGGGGHVLSPFTLCQHQQQQHHHQFGAPALPVRRMFDVESLLAPEPKPLMYTPRRPLWSPLLASVASAAAAAAATAALQTKTTTMTMTTTTTMLATTTTTRMPATPTPSPPPPLPALSSPIDSPPLAGDGLDGLDGLNPPTGMLIEPRFE